LALTGVLVLAACAGGCAGSPSWTTGRQVQVEARPDANQGNATELDIVLVHEREALALLPKTGPEWFRSKAALLSALARDVTVVSLQVPPPAPAFDVKLPKRSEQAVAVLGFANYLSAEGQQVGDITSFRCARIVLKATSVDYLSCR
jgi:type VI secretion system protein